MVKLRWLGSTPTVLQSGIIARAESNNNVATWCIPNESIKEQPRTINAEHRSRLYGIVKVSIAYPYELILPIMVMHLLETRSVLYLLLLLPTTNCLEGEHGPFSYQYTVHLRPRMDHLL
jgi:hypothetical protein